MFQFAFPAELLPFRLNGPEFVPLFTLPPEMTTDRAFLYPHIFTSYFYLRPTFVSASEFRRREGSRHACVTVPLPEAPGEKSPPVPLEMVTF